MSNASPIGRGEKRTAKAVEVTGYRSDGSSLREGTFTENVSAHGARIVTMSMLELGGTIEIHLPYGGFRLHGRVVYCQPLFAGKFAAGLLENLVLSPHFVTLEDFDEICL
jgi:PilZ domain